MRKIGCILSITVSFTCLAGVYAFGIFGTDKVHTPDYYEANVRAMFKNGNWQQGKKLLDEGLKNYPEVYGLNVLNGQYYYIHKRDYDNARYYLVKAARSNPSAVEAKQLLIRVEDETKNYSSAICYVNELLEINPYWRGLWLKKIGIYRKQGNDVMADHLLKRLHQIYPNDASVSRAYANSLGEDYVRKRKRGDKDAAIASLEELIKADNRNETYYMDLTNLLLQEGYTERALEVAARGAVNIPHSTALVAKRAGILAGEARYQEALAYIKTEMRHNRSGRLSRLYNELMADAARAAQMNDPYTMYGKVYATSGSQEALDFLLNTSVTRGYYEDALHYLAEAKRRRGETPSLLYKEYTVYKRMGNSRKAFSLLSTLVEIEPDNAELADEFARNRLQQASGLISDGLYSEALPYLLVAARKGHEGDILSSALSRIYTCYYEMHRYDKALALADSLAAADPSAWMWTVRKADVLYRSGDTDKALAVLETAMLDTTNTEMHAAYASAYEEKAIPYIKSLVEQGATRKAFDESERLLRVNPSSKEGLQYAIGMADLLHRFDAYDRYVAAALSIYPGDPTFVVKQAASYNRTGSYQRAIDLVHPWLYDYPDNEALVGAFSENSRLLATSMVRQHRPEDALAVADSALVYDEKNGELMLVKGQAYESMHRYDSAWVYQSKYTPGLTEARSFMRHLEGLKSRSYKNEIAVTYLQGRYGEEDVITSVASAYYTRKERRDTYTAGVNYAGRDGSAVGEDPTDQVPGGVGVQGNIDWEHKFSDKWTGGISLAAANKYFPSIMTDVRASLELKHDWALSAHASFRRFCTYTKTFRWNNEGMGGWEFDKWKDIHNNLFSAGLGISKTWEQLVLSGKVDGFLLSSNLYVNASAQLKYFPLDDGRTSLTVLGGLGTAPEANLIDNAMPGSFDKLNTTVGLGGMYMLNKHITMGLMGTWYTYYSQLNRRIGDMATFEDVIDTRYKNLYNIYFQLYVHF